MVCFFVTTQRASLQTSLERLLINTYVASAVMWWLVYFSFRIHTFDICSSVIRTVMKHACPSEKIRSHLFMNRATRAVFRLVWPSILLQSARDRVATTAEIVIASRLLWIVHLI